MIDPERTMPEPDGFEEEQAELADEAEDEPQFPSVDRERVLLGAGGRFVIPAAMRKALGIKTGDVLIARVENGELIAVPQQIAIKKVQAYFKQFKKPGESVVDEFIAERRAMWGED